MSRLSGETSRRPDPTVRYERNSPKSGIFWGVFEFSTHKGTSFSASGGRGPINRFYEVPLR